MKRERFSWAYAERTGLELWFGVCFALGILIYFSLPEEPPLWGAIFLALTAGVVWSYGFKEFFSRLVLGYIFFACFGFAVASVKTYLVAAPVLPAPLFETGIAGTVVKVEPYQTRQRITLENVRIENVDNNAAPVKVRLNFHETYPHIKVGDKVEAIAHILPPMLPVQTGAYDFSRDAWFKQIGAIGKITELTGHTPIENSNGFSQWLEHVRDKIATRINDILPSETAGVAIPLIIGEQGTVPPQTYQLYRVAGIVHVLSVSGFHLTLIAGLVFFLIRGLLSLFTGLSERVNAKKIAAFLSILIVGFYLLISGLQLPAIRSFIMVTIVLLGVLFDRRAISLRSVMLAGVVILFFWPESLMSVSFQLSFMAVFALVSLYEVFMRHLQRTELSRFFVYKAFLLVAGMTCVSVLATLVTAPYAAYHFNQFVPYSVLGNLATELLFSFAIMPLLLAAVVFMPFGGDKLFLQLAGRCLDKVTEICGAIARLPHADVTVPAFDAWGLILISFGFIWLFLFSSRIRWLGLLFLLPSIFAFNTIPKADLLVSEGGKVFAVREADGKLKLSDAGANTFASDVWLRRNGQDPIKYPPDNVFTDRAIRIKGHKISFSSLNCVNAEVSFLTKWEMGDCPGIVITKQDLWDNKTHEVFVTKDGIKVQNIKDGLSKRPWHNAFSLAKQPSELYSGQIED